MFVIVGRMRFGNEQTLCRATPKPQSISDHYERGEQTEKKTILFVHFHKSGGTMVCQTALRSGYNITNAMGLPDENIEALNCNTPFSGPKTDVRRYSSLQSCKAMSLYNRITDFVAVEVPFQEAMPCPSFLSFALMRNPVDRVQSHMRFHSLKRNEIINWVQSRKPCNRSSFVFGYPIVNSMVIRQLLGRERYTDTAPVNEADLERAKQIVDSFDVFVPMEYLEMPHVADVLSQKMPLFAKALKDHLASSAVGVRSYDNATSDFVQLLEKENQYDLRLYDYVLRKHRIENS